MKKTISFILTALMILNLCSCSKGDNTNYHDGEETFTNYLGGEGAFLNLADYGNNFEDDINIYLGYSIGTLKKINKKSKTYSVACAMPGCSHDNVSCKAYFSDKNYVVFNGSLIKILNEQIEKDDGTKYTQGYLYRCDGKNEEMVFKNSVPDNLDSSLAEYTEPGIPWTHTVGEYLAVFCQNYTYFLDKDFNIKYTVFDMGGAISAFCISGEIYYISNLYHLMKIDRETGAGLVVEPDGIRLTEGVSDGEKIWYSNDYRELCSYDPQTGDISKYADEAVRLSIAGKYVEYMVYDAGEVYVLDTESGETSPWNDCDINDGFVYADGNYYTYSDTELAEYDENLSRVNTYPLAD